MSLAKLDVALRSASVRSEDDRLVVSTGVVSRTWLRTPQGLLTVGLTHLLSRSDWANRRREPESGCDWALPGILDDAAGQLISLTACVSDDDGFTSEHVRVVAEFAYPGAGLTVRWSIWAYPDAPGLRTQLAVKGAPRGTARESGRCDLVPMQFGHVAVREIGYYAGTQNRNMPETPLLRSELFGDPPSTRRVHEWGSVLLAQRAGAGLALVKESHKCVNQPGHDGGAFVCDPQSGVHVTGWGLLPEEIIEDRFRSCWATWCVLFAGEPPAFETAIKSFDRLRYPVDPARDIYTIANTWGSTASGVEAKHAAREENVLCEIDSQADLGIDVQQVDDGWQGNQYDSWRPVQERYPDGWGRVVERARGKGVRMGLWAAAQRIPLDDLIRSYEHGGFRQYKLDFAVLDSHEKIEALMTKVRAFIEHTEHNVRVNWDLTENPPRFGYFYGREYGCIYLANRKPEWPQQVIYRPYLMLRDLWEIAHFVNLNRFQGTIQNVDRVDRQLSDACLHSHAYSVAIALMSTPVFFQETHYYDEAARTQIRPLLAAHKAHREAICRGIVYPVGDCPSNRSWTGFQSHDHESGTGYLLVFRERLCAEPATRLSCVCVADGRLRITDLLTGEGGSVTVGCDGAVPLSMPAGEFRFLHYEPAQ